jgi:dihydroneopterin aldolase
VIVELTGLRLHGYHGVYPEEREHGQTFLFDVELEVGARGASDRIEDAVDYAEVAACVKAISDERAYHLLEALATAIADELMRRFTPERLAVRVRKPEVTPAGLEVEHAAVTVARP